MKPASVIANFISPPLPQKCAELGPTCVHAAAIHESPTAPCQVLLETQMLDLLHADVHAAINFMEAVTSDGWPASRRVMGGRTADCCYVSGCLRIMSLKGERIHAHNDLVLPKKRGPSKNEVRVLRIALNRHCRNAWCSVASFSA